MRLSKLAFVCAFTLAFAAGCGDKTASVVPNPVGGDASGGTPAGQALPGGPVGAGTTQGVGCSGTYHYQNGAVSQDVVLNADGSCQISNPQGIVEDPADCRFTINSGSLTISSRGVSVYWGIALDCSYLWPTAGTNYLRN